MSDRIFLDTNILVYSYSTSELDKKNTARSLISDSISYISTQVLQELINTVTKKLGFSYEDAINAAIECSKNNLVHTNSEQTILKACDIAIRYQYSFYDSLIISAALECKSSRLYSEDMQDGHIIDGVLRIINPFKG
jgi:predicted nucleic acid-binding protein